MAFKLLIVASLLAAAQAGIIGAPLGLAGLGLGSPLALSAPGIISSPRIVSLSSPAVAVSSQSVTRTLQPQLIATSGVPAGIALAGLGGLGGPTRILGAPNGLILAPGQPAGLVATSLASPGLIAGSPIGATRIISSPGISPLSLGSPLALGSPLSLGSPLTLGSPLGLGLGGHY